MPLPHPSVLCLNSMSMATALLKNNRLEVTSDKLVEVLRLILSADACHPHMGAAMRSHAACCDGEETAPISTVMDNFTGNKQPNQQPDPVMDEHQLTGSSQQSEIRRKEEEEAAAGMLFSSLGVG